MTLAVTAAIYAQLAASVWGLPAPAPVVFTDDPQYVACAGADPAAGCAAKGGPIYLPTRFPGARSWPRRVLCDVILHESGHVAGVPHSTNSLSIMYPIRVYVEMNGRYHGADHRCDAPLARIQRRMEG